MPYTIHWETQGVYKKYTGEVSGHEFAKAVEHVNAAPNFEILRYVINDFSDCRALNLSSSAIEEAVASAIGASTFNPRFVAAFVAADREIHATLRRIVELASSYMPVMLFDCLTDARTWVKATET